jgi:murein DD-endopeptidase MepM/ murein hydrolase activator NlpD
VSVTPIKDFIFVIDNQEIIEQRKKITDLQSKVEVLSNQLQSILSTNERMKFALKLAKKDSAKADDPIYDTLKNRINKKLEIGGNILLVFEKLFREINFSQDEKRILFFQEPASGVITQNYNPEKGHIGIDFGLKIGSPVYASAGGIVVFSDYTIDDGYCIIINHDNDYVTVYKHCSYLLKKARSFVRQGEMIALSGNSGKNTSGPHLHFEIWQKGKPINPSDIIIK